jgi:hypothetical protein
VNNGSIITLSSDAFATATAISKAVIGAGVLSSADADAAAIGAGE